MDSTTNPKLDALIAAFKSQGGEVYIGEAAWEHLDVAAGQTMSRFINKYVKAPMQDVLSKAMDRPPDFTAQYGDTSIRIIVGEEQLLINRASGNTESAIESELPPDADDDIPGV
jgi:hypothetical protein